MKKVLCLLLSICFICISFSACGEDGFTDSFSPNFLNSQSHLSAKEWLASKENALSFAAFAIIDTLVCLTEKGDTSECIALQNAIVEALDLDINDSNNLHLAILQTNDEVSFHSLGTENNIQIKYNTKTQMAVYIRNQMPLPLTYYQQYRLMKLPAQETQSKYLEMLSLITNSTK